MMDNKDSNHGVKLQQVISSKMVTCVSKGNGCNYLFLKVKHSFATGGFWLLKIGSEMENLPIFIGKVLGFLGERMSEV